MQVTQFDISGPLLIELDTKRDSRGFFVERYHPDISHALGFPQFIQDNFSRSEPGVLRGLHYQWREPQSKLVTVTSGHILDVAVDIRANSPTRGQSISVELTGEKPAWLWVPFGFAHGFQVLGASPADVLYKVDACYGPQGESGIRWDDPLLNIRWQAGSPIISDKDQRQPSWTDYLKDPKFH